MSERKFLFMSSDGFSEEAAQADSITLGGLTMGGNVAMGTNKVTGLASAASDGDALAYGQSNANLAGLTIDTANLVMSNNQITGVLAGDGAGDALAYGQSGASLTGLSLSDDLDMVSSNKILNLGAATVDGNAIAFGQSGANLAGLDIDTAAVTMNSQKITGLANGTASGDAVNKSQLDQAVITGGTVKEAVLVGDQLDDAEGVLAASALTMQAQPVSGDVITLTDGTTTRGYGATTGGDVQYTIGGTLAETMTNLAAAIEGDSALGAWGASFTTDLVGIDTDGVVAISELDNDGGASKVHGVWATQANCEIVDFTGETDYTKKALVTLPSSAPGSSNFGVRRTSASLTDGEIHLVLESDVLKSWDDSADIWEVLSGGSSIPDATGGSGGGVKGKATYDTDYGLSVTAGVVKANITANKGLQFNAGALEIELDDTPDTLDADADGLKVVGLPSLFKINGVAVGAAVTTANLDDVLDGSSADTLHTHTDTSVTVTHTSTTGQTANDHHNQSHVLTGGDHTESGLTIGHVLTATSATAFAFQELSSLDAAHRIKDNFVAVEAVTKADPVYHSSTSGKFGKADAGVDAKSYVFGVAEADIAQDAAGAIVSLGIAGGVLVGATPGACYYLQNTGGIGTSLPGAGKRVIMVGWAVSATDLWVQMADFGKAAS